MTKKNRIHVYLCFICIVPPKILHSQFKCDFCPITFQTEDNLNAHVLEHFVKKNCSNCNKLLLRIGSQWYKLHVDESNDSGDHDHKDDLELDAIAQINVEKLDDELEFNNSNDHDIVLDSKVSDAFSSSDSDEESLIEIFKSNKRKRSAAKTESQSKNEENKTVTTKKRNRKGPLPRIKCRICDRIILKYNFDIHLQKMHVPNVIVTKEPVKCETCGKSLANAGSLKTHRAIHTGTKRFGIPYMDTL